MLSKETIEEVIIETPLHDGVGNFCSLPLSGSLLLEVFKKSWLNKKFPEGQVPLVSMGPKKLLNGREGYSIRKEIVYKHNCQP